MVFTYEEWVEKALFPMFVRRGIKATLEADGTIVCEKDGFKQVTPKEKALIKYNEYVEKYRV
jgi:hypothetical protein